MSQAPPSTTNSKLAELFYEKETEFYGIPPFALLDEVGEAVVNGVLGMIERSPEAMTKKIDFLSPAQIESGLGQWADLVEQMVSKYFDLFEQYSLKNVLLLPESFILPNHRHLEEFPGSPELDDEIANLLAELQAEKGRAKALEARAARLQQEEAFLSTLEAQFISLQAVLSNHSVDFLADALESLDGQIGALKSIVLDTLEASANAFAFGEDEQLAPFAGRSGISQAELPMDTKLMSRILALELKSCGAVGNPSDLKPLFSRSKMPTSNS